MLQFWQWLLRRGLQGVAVTSSCLGLAQDLADPGSG